MPGHVAPVTFFGYWSGDLPPVTQLHFRSFLRHHPGARYELWLDDDAASTISAPALQWITSHPRIAVRRLSLDALIEKHVSARPVASYDRWPRLRALASALHRRLAPQWARSNAWEHALFGLTYKHASLLFDGFTRDKAYRGDLARCLVALEHYAGPCLYVDLDVCFTTDLSTLCADKAWAYRWESHAFASTALLYLPTRSWSTALVRKGNELGSFRPWILFDDHACAELGVVVHPAKLFDPAWDSSSLLYGDPAKFFVSRPNLALDLHALATERHLAIHWHNNWRTVPAPDSLYAGMLKNSEGAHE
jgi:hypothetical protein